MEKIIISEKGARSFRLVCAYNIFLSRLPASQTPPRLFFGKSRVAVVQETENFTPLQKRIWEDILSEVFVIGYKYDYLAARLPLSALSGKSRHYFLCALIAADLLQDKEYVLSRISADGCALDGFFSFRLRGLQKKWDKIISYIPADFSSAEADRFLKYLVDGNKGEVYVSTEEVFGCDCRPCRRSLLLNKNMSFGAETEILLSCAGSVCITCLPQKNTLEFLQKYYGSRVVFGEHSFF